MTTGRRVRALVGLLLVLLAAGPVAAKESKLDKTIAKEHGKIATVWLKLAGELAAKGMQEPATAALARARELAPDHKDLAKTTAAVEGIADAVDPDEAAEKRIRKARATAAKGHDKIAKACEKAGDTARGLQATLAAFALDPSKKRTAALVGRGQKQPLLLTSPTHAAAAYVSFPKDWKAGKAYPVLVSVDGAGANFLGNAKAFKNGRGSRSFITVAPHALSCTNAINKNKFPAYSQALIDEWNSKRVDFDVPGLLAMLDFLHERFGAEKQVAITGFSGGGNLCYGFTLRHPDRVRCAAPACANFVPSLASGAATPEGGGPPIHVMTGEKDPHRHLTHGKTPPGIEEQTDWAMKAFQENGFTQVKRTMLPGVGHSNLVKQVWAFVDETYAK